MKKGTYIEGFVISIPKKNTAKYKKMAQEGLKVWMKYGALDYKECIMDIKKYAKGPMDMPFDMKRMAHATFRVVVGA